MKRTSFVLLSVLSASPLLADAGQHLIPAGSLIGCTISEPRLSSKTTAVGDPVLCQVGHSERYGRSVLPYNSYLVGRFEDYKDPGHFVGKGWMELRFDRMVIEPDTVIPIDARVIDAPGYRVDNQGRILGKGHVARDITMWSIPILWPIDLIMLPMRGPRPVLKEETRLTLKVMDDLAIPDAQPPQQDDHGLTHREPTADNTPPPAPDQEPAPEVADAAPDVQPQPEPYTEAPAVIPPPPPAYIYAPAFVAPPPVVYAPGGTAWGGGYAYSRPGYTRAVRGYGYAQPARGYGYGYGYGYRPQPRSYAYGYGSAPRAPYGAAPGRAPQGYGGGRPTMTARAGMARGGYRR